MAENMRAEDGVNQSAGDETINGANARETAENSDASQNGTSTNNNENVKSPDFSEVEEPKGDGNADGSNGNSIDMVLDIPVTISVELGRTRMVINDLLQLGHGSVIELEKIAGEPLEILVNDKLVARGEVVVVNEKFGVRLTDIVSPLERIKHLKK